MSMTNFKSNFKFLFRLGFAQSFGNSINCFKHWVFLCHLSRLIDHWHGFCFRWFFLASEHEKQSLTKLEILSSVDHNVDRTVDNKQEVGKYVQKCWPVQDTPVEQNLESVVNKNDKSWEVTAEEDDDDREEKTGDGSITVLFTLTLSKSCQRFED